eukprot:gene25708-33056_t
MTVVVIVPYMSEFHRVELNDAHVASISLNDFIARVKTTIPALSGEVDPPAFALAWVNEGGERELIADDHQLQDAFRVMASLGGIQVDIVLQKPVAVPVASEVSAASATTAGDDVVPVTVETATQWEGVPLGA